MKDSGETPLLNALVKRRRLKTTPFHMPGHKMGKGLLSKFAKLMRNDPFAFDLTEVPGLDDLHNPTGPIKDAQSRASRLFGAEHTFFLVNGTTVGIHASILAVCKQGEEIILPRDIHRSAIGACILAGARPIYLPLRVDPDFFIPYPPTADEVALVLQTHPSAKSVFQVYPSYYGLASDLTSIARLAHSRGLPVIVDEAHGSHFKFNEQLPLTALESGADLSVQSTHKTLGAFTQASMLHIGSRLVKADDVRRQLHILQTTSPSYLLMASLDAAIGHMELSGNTIVTKTVEIANRVRAELKLIPGLKCLDEEVCGKNGTAAFDPTKLYISTQDVGLTGYQAAELLIKKYRIQVELGDRLGILCLFSIGTSPADADNLVRALREIAAGGKQRKIKRSADLITLPLSKVVLTPREAWFAVLKTVPLKDSVGEIAAEAIALYPPGVPLICPGEMITNEVIEVINKLRAESGSFHGPADPNLRRITIVDSC